MGWSAYRLSDGETTLAQRYFIPGAFIAFSVYAWAWPWLYGAFFFNTYAEHGVSVRTYVRSAIGTLFVHGLGFVIGSAYALAANALNWRYKTDIAFFQFGLYAFSVLVLSFTQAIYNWPSSPNFNAGDPHYLSFLATLNDVHLLIDIATNGSWLLFIAILLEAAFSAGRRKSESKT